MHKFEELSHEGCSLKERLERLPKKVSEATYMPAKTKPVVALQQCVSHRSSAEWSSTAAEGQPKWYAHAAWFLELHATKSHTTEDCSAQGLCTAFLPGMVVREKGTKDWWLSLGHVCSVAALALPLQEAEGGFLRPQVEGQVQHRWLLVKQAGLAKWEALPCCFVPPGRILGSTSAGKLSPALCLRREGEPGPVLDGCLRWGFSGLGDTEVRQLLVLLGKTPDPEAPLFSAVAFVLRLWALI